MSWGGGGGKLVALDFWDWSASDTMSKVPWWLGFTMEKMSWCTRVTKKVPRRARRRVEMPGW